MAWLVNVPTVIVVGWSAVVEAAMASVSGWAVESCVAGVYPSAEVRMIVEGAMERGGNILVRDVLIVNVQYILRRCVSTLAFYLMTGIVLAAYCFALDRSARGVRSRKGNPCILHARTPGIPLGLCI